MPRLFPLLIALCACAITGVRADLKLLRSPVEAAAVPKVAEALKRLRVTSVNQSHLARFPEMLNQVELGLNVTMNDAEKQEDIYVVVSRSMEMNASFLKLSKTQRLVILNMGLLDFCEEDSEVIGA